MAITFTQAEMNGGNTGITLPGGPLQNANYNPQPAYDPGLQTTATTNDQYLGGNITGYYGDTSTAGDTGGTTTAQPAYVDPWASTPWGSKANYDQAVADYNATKTNTMNSITDSISNSALQQKSSVLDFVDEYGTAQKGINSDAVQNEMQREQGRLGVLDMIGTGIRSGAVTLNNANAANSSAAEALAKAYGILGRQDMTKVGNKYALGQEGIKKAQEQLAGRATTFRRHAEENKTLVINSIVSDAVQKISALDAAAANASLPDRMNIESEKARIRSEAMTALSQYDSVLNDGIAQNAPQSDADRRAEAYRLMNAGTAPENLYQYTTTVPQGFENTGPFASTLPIFTGY